MNALICWLFGHKWCDWQEVKQSMFVLAGRERECVRCNRWNYQSNFEYKTFAIGQTIYIKKPARYLVTKP